MCFRSTLWLWRFRHVSVLFSRHFVSVLSVLWLFNISDVVEERVKEARWVCCLISNNTIKKKRFIEFWLAALLNKCIEKNHLKIVILLKDVDSSYIPNFIQWVTYIDIVNEPSFEERIFEIIKGMSLSLLLWLWCNMSCGVICELVWFVTIFIFFKIPVLYVNNLFTFYHKCK